MTAKRVDANQKEIVKAFRDLGCSVLIISNIGKGAPDIVVGKNGKTYLFEIKDGNKLPSQQKLTPHEEAFHADWKGHVEIIKSIDEVVNFMNFV